MASTRSFGPLKPRVDFAKSDFDRLIREKGYRCLWEAAELCPCRLNSATDQPDPSCPICDAAGYVYTFPDPGQPEMDEYAKESPPFLSTDTGRATQAVLTSMTHDPQVFEKFGEWLTGTAALTTFSFHRVGYRDRFSIVDFTQLYRQVVAVPSDQIVRVKRAERETLRYRVVRLQRAFAVTATGVIVDYTETAAVNDDGSLLVTAPVGTRLSVSYEYNPIWVVVDYPHAFRGSLIKFKTKKVMGDVEILPIQAMVRLDFLVSDGVAP